MVSQLISRPSSVEAPGYSIPNSSTSPSILRLSETPDEKAWLVFLPRKDREELGLSFDVPKSN